jgi:adenylate cyclase
MAKAPERKPATVLIAELRNVTRLSEALPPDRVLAIANEFFALCARVVIAEGGRVLSVHNDSLLAAFLDDEPKNCNKNAIKAAKGIRGAFGSIGEPWQKQYGLPAAMAVGVHAGEVVFGMAGPMGAQQFVAFGDCVSIADRLVHRARAGEVVISFEVIEALGSSAAQSMGLEELPALELGKRPPLPIYGLVLETRLDFTNNEGGLK